VTAPDPGLPELPANALDDARALLHPELVATFAAVGWAGFAERLNPYPTPTPQVPGGWIDAATLSRQGNGLLATFPIVFTVDSNEREQIRRLDGLLAILWQRLEAVKIPHGLRLVEGSTLDVMTAGPEQLDIGGPSVRSVTLVVQVPISPRTLCPTALTSPTGEPS
jgi:hypothetical protein